ncbi:MAG: hypothetical protein AAFO17_13335 [Pseudomonadota bacterium]
MLIYELGLDKLAESKVNAEGLSFVADRVERISGACATFRGRLSA